MRAALLQKEGQINIVDVPRPTPGPDEVLIDVAYAGVCGSDLHSFRGSHPFRKPPVVLGHELSGTVAEVGSRVSGLETGQAVTVMPYVHCGQCAMCARGHTHICLNKRVPGIKGWVGTFAEAFCAPASVTFPLGENTDLRAGALTEPLAVAVHSADRGRVAQGDRVLILGAGAIGLLTGVAAVQAGASRVVVTDLLAHNLEVGAAMGFLGLQADRPDLLEVAGADGPFDVVFLTGGAPVTVGQALTLAQRRARIVATALFAHPVPLDLGALTLGELELIGTQIYQRQDYDRALAWLDAGDTGAERIIDHVLPLDRAQQALEMLHTRGQPAIKILLQP